MVIVGKKEFNGTALSAEEWQHLQKPGVSAEEQEYQQKSGNISRRAGTSAEALKISLGH
ncbi:hypothetical protein [Lentibacillus sp. CBA3610]|uniref:hypothetical protein n=1 Tax=Lentibacillus sp. CBA3610 TaxID=2518176 RepID=UPI0015952BEC|nr:hypothetical protein [Lentibacillus sp. CBA3610]